MFMTLTIPMMALLVGGCVRMALHMSPALIPRLADSIFEECDAALAKDALPADLKLMEGLLKSDPKNEQLLNALCMGFAGYANLFVEDEDPERASRLYVRARNYGLKALGLSGVSSEKSNSKEVFLLSSLKTVDDDDIDALFWMTLSWNAWINLNLDKPLALAQLGQAGACLDTLLRIKPDYYYGAPYVLKGTIAAAMPGLLGGNAESAKAAFEKALQLGERKLFLTHYYYAKYYAVRVQDKALFTKLLREIEKGIPNQLKGACLINSVIQKKAKKLNDISEDLFL